MGYNVWLDSRHSKFRIPADKVEGCVQSMLSTKDKWIKESIQDAKKHIKYFEHIPPLPKLIELVYNIWGFRFTPNTENAIDKVTYELEKMHAFEEFCGAIAPFVESGSFLEFKGEDGAAWRYVFKDGNWKEVKPKVVWPDD